MPFDIVKFSTDKDPKGTKSYCEYSNEGFTIVDVLLEKNFFISWTSVEVIFLSNRPPGDGEYHNFEYSIILNKEPIETNFENQKWYNKIFKLSKTKNNQLPLIRINDYWHKDFKTFAPAIEQYLVNTHSHLNEFLENKFGNKTIAERKNGITYLKSEKPLKQFGFYKIFDRNNKLKDNRLEQFREDSK
jgi:hypothetical protein